MDQNAPVGISFQEFEQLQLQIVTLKTENYDLQSKSSKINKELQELRQKTESLGNENQRLNKIISRDKSAQSYEKLLKENERLQQQETDFQLQCQTLVAEITQLMSDKELLSKSVEQYRQVINDMTISPGELDAMRSELEALRGECAHLRANALPPSHDPSAVELDGNIVNSDANRSTSLSVESVTSERDSMVTDTAVHELKMQLASAQNERKLLLTQLDESKKVAASLQSAVDSATASASQSSQELEIATTENKKSLAELEMLRERCSQLQGYQHKYESAENDLRSALTEKSDLVKEHKIEVESLQNELSKLREDQGKRLLDIESLGAVVADLREELATYRTAAESSSNELDKSRTTCSELQAEIEAKSNRIKEFEEQYAEATRQIEALIGGTEDLEQQLAELNSNAELGRQEKEELRDKLGQKEAELEQLSQQAFVAQSDMEKAQTALQDEQDRSSALEAELVDMRTKKDAELDELRKEIQLIRQNAEQEVLTNRRKDAAKMKDLQRQLKMEKKRVEQLQDRLEQLFQQGSALNPQDSSPHHTSGWSADMSDRKSIDHDFETSSVSSFSLSNLKNALSKTFSTSGAAGMQNSTPASSHGVPIHGPPFSTNLSAETASDLAAQIDKLNIVIDGLRERVSYLESTNGAMAEDIIKKQSLIDHYLMSERDRSSTISPSVSLNNGIANNGTPRTTKNESPGFALKSLFEKVSSNASAQANSAEETKRLRRAMEEILTKNMSLEADLQRLSEENSKLRIQRTSEASTASTVTH